MGTRMSKGKHRFRRTDLIRAIKAARDAGEDVRKFKITSDGEIEVEMEPPSDHAEVPNEWDAAE
jgi:hypothetical protein